MSQITLIRHGQANTEARDEAEYDKLSPLGHQQAAWLGDHLRASGTVQGRVYCGSLTRHLETAASMGLGDGIVVDPRLNELQYFTMAQLLEQQHGIPIPKERDSFAEHMPKVFGAWQRDELDDVPESFAEFETRVRAAIADIAEGPGPALVVTSGGLISMVMRQFLGLDIPAMSQMALAIMNTSMHRLFPIGNRLSPVLFNAVPHLETPERQFAQTHM
ncbi:histidine phosphatase family protein [Pseudodonghicola flavimaris]|uniref:Histidine phosphatase family protein n=1 Tax=Pseudodonghicola flavimaris TaxID=3050036 RepID=A0ABT7EWR2_9RHOB|nr:histidine phosphatase family protein [Pseudodonghicola flavimaris]MDK3016785.1 histidine phosphatase family protein [Pseudodonghicola flavimaris]